MSDLTDQEFFDLIPLNVADLEEVAEWDVTVGDGLEDDPGPESDYEALKLERDWLRKTLAERTADLLAAGKLIRQLQAEAGPEASCPHFIDGYPEMTCRLPDRHDGPHEYGPEVERGD